MATGKCKGGGKSRGRGGGEEQEERGVVVNC